MLMNHLVDGGACFFLRLWKEAIIVDSYLSPVRLVCDYEHGTFDRRTAEITRWLDIGCAHSGFFIIQNGPLTPAL